MVQNAKQDLQKSVKSKKDELNKLGRDLDHVGQSCNPLKRGFNEYCPDIFRQEGDVKRLKNRYTTVNNQLQERQGLLTQLFTLGNHGSHCSVESQRFLNTLHS